MVLGLAGKDKPLEERPWDAAQNEVRLTAKCTSKKPRLEGLKRETLIGRDLRRVEKTRQRREVVVDTAVRHIPKLDVAGSSPVSRSIISITYEIRD